MVRRIPLTQGQYALVDDEDYGWLIRWKWTVAKGRAVRSERVSETPGITRHNRKKIQMHRVILGARPGEQVDHINRDKLDNRRENLRIATGSQNQHNKAAILLRKGKETSSVYKGVSWNRKKRKWWVGIAVNGKTIHVGRFNDEVEAAKAYDEAARRLHGEFACLNFRYTT